MEYSSKAVKKLLKHAHPHCLSRKQVVSELLSSIAWDSDTAKKSEKKRLKKLVLATFEAFQTAGKIVVGSDATVTWVGKKSRSSSSEDKSAGRKRPHSATTTTTTTTTTNESSNSTNSQPMEQPKTKKTKKSKKKKHKKNKASSSTAADDAADDAAEKALLAKHSGHSTSTASTTSSTTTSTTSSSNSSTTTTTPTADQTTIVLFYAYVDPQFTRHEQDECMAYCTEVLTAAKVTGRLRIGREGFNGTLTGSYEGTREFVAALRSKWPTTFATTKGAQGDCHTNFKFVDGLPASQRLNGLKVFPVTEIVTYGFDPKEAPLDMRGQHLSPQEFHTALEGKNTICLDVRNFNESLIGKFVPPGDIPVTGAPGVVTDMLMRRSTDFPKWVARNRHRIEGKKVLLYCTAGVRCERASAFLRNKGIDDVYQLDGGVHRYLEHFKEGGGHWKGKNYTFDKRYAHGADNVSVETMVVFVLVCVCVCLLVGIEGY